MKDYAKTGGKKGKPAYRTPSRFIANKSISNKKTAWRPWDQASRLENRTVKPQRKRSKA